jgi:putative restriction endonuclease
MIYLEMSRDKEHGGRGWGFTECLWSPTRKSNGTHWRFWDLLLQVRKGDIILHLRGKTGDAAFVGYSTALSNGYITKNRPTIEKEWKGFEYYRVDLADYQKFADPILLISVFDQQRELLTEYYKKNTNKSKIQREHLFFVIQRSKLQCLNGAYLSEVNPELAAIILGPDFSGIHSTPRPPGISVKTGEQIGQLKTRFGQNQFSENVRKNYGGQCCFPGCGISDNEFLIGAHIARWADNLKLRGDTANGLCLCLFHDKAFERGMFVLTEDFKVAVNRTAIKNSSWAKKYILPYDGQRIILGDITPSVESIHEHWERTGYRPNQ